MKTIKLAAAVCASVLVGNAHADGLNWQYFDSRYQQPSDDSTRGFAGEVSGHISKNWILQARGNRLLLEDDVADLEVSQTRFDLAAGRIFNLGDRLSMAVTVGYSRLESEVNLPGSDNDLEFGDNVGNAQVALRAHIIGGFEAEASVGMLFDDETNSDALWNAAIRYRATRHLSFTLGAVGVDSENFDTDDILYEAGFRFDMRED